MNNSEKKENILDAFFYNELCRKHLNAGSQPATPFLSTQLTMQM